MLRRNMIYLIFICVFFSTKENLIFVKWITNSFEILDKIGGHEGKYFAEFLSEKKEIYKTNGSLWKIGCDKLLFDLTEIIEEGLSYVL